jgi:arginyl-tRNA synthetase
MDVIGFIKKKISSIFTEITKSDSPEFSMVFNENPAFGDISANAAMVCYAKVKETYKSPRELAEKIVERLMTDEEVKSLCEKVTVDGPGFINFTLSSNHLQAIVKQINKAGKDYGASDMGNGKKVLVEFVSANPTGPLHMGNARGGPIGDVLGKCASKDRV